ncbi:serine hydrolase domain-containing protein [Humibacter ginsenosidimutans]|uniref:Serine hydrolase n=1 Tax=Humibacter ginsenosidimutans TaxID=2599293 RepID=A0A5B8M630_9MICO|nr:serine hydrolase [Humibacter ginsenosidimutans]QDZ15082.1 serine hydrolase [Humibacter ginsenosidimutans]
MPATEPHPADSAAASQAVPQASSWRASSAEAEGVDPAAVLALLDEIDAEPTIDPHAVIVLRHGAVIASAQWAPYAIDRPQLVYSLSKSFTSTAAGFAVAEGLLDLDAPAADYFPEYADSVAPASRRILVRHLASMATGHLEDMITAFGADREHPIRAFFAAPPEREPGTLFTYNQMATYTLAVIVQRRSGQRLTEYLQPRLFEPLGIDPMGWQQQPADVDLGFSGLFAPPEAVAKLGRLYLDDGVWNGRRLLPASWVHEATSVQVANAVPGGPVAAESDDWQQGYGFQFWMSRHGYRGDGAFGQYCIVLPEHDAIVAITSQTADMQDLIDRVWKHLLPAFHDAPLAAAPEGGDALHGIVRDIAFPALRSPAALPADASGEYTRAADARSAQEYGALARATLERVDSGWRVTLHEDVAALGGDDGWAAAVGPLRDAATPTGTVGGPVGDGVWAVTEGGESGTLEVPVAVRGGILDTDAPHGPLRVDLAFIDTPHRLSLYFDPESRVVTPRWQTQALGFVGAYQLRAVRPGETFTVAR